MSDTCDMRYTCGVCGEFNGLELRYTTNRVAFQIAHVAHCDETSIQKGSTKNYYTVDTLHK